MKKLIKNIKIVVSILTISYIIAACTKIDDANQKLPQIVAGFTSALDTATGTVIFTNISKNGDNYAARCAKTNDVLGSYVCNRQSTCKK